jgi:hypothetical protein
MCAIVPHMNETPTLRTRTVNSNGTPSHQYGYYEMRTQGSTGKRRSYFKVLVNLDEHETPEIALSEWPDEVERLRRAGRAKRADWLQGKLEKLGPLMDG